MDEPGLAFQQSNTISSAPFNDAHVSVNADDIMPVQYTLPINEHVMITKSIDNSFNNQCIRGLMSGSFFEIYTVFVEITLNDEHTMFSIKTHQFSEYQLASTMIVIREPRVKHVSEW